MCVLGWRSQQKVSSEETHKGAETCLPDDFISFSWHLYWCSRNFAQHKLHLEEFLLAEAVRGSYRITVSGRWHVNLIGSFGKQKACWCLQWCKEILTSTANASWPNKENKGIWEKLWMSNYGQKKCYQIWKRSKPEHCQGLHWWFKTKWESRSGILCRIPKQLPKTSIFPPWNLQHCVPGRSLSYFTSG